VDDYRVKMCDQISEECSFELVASSTAGQRTYTATGLVKGTFYKLRVQAHNAIGFGAESQSLTAVAANKPNQPLSLKNNRAVTDRSSIGVTWEAPIQDVGSLITSYIVRWKTQAEGDYLNSYETADAQIFAHTIRGLS